MRSYSIALAVLSTVYAAVVLSQTSDEEFARRGYDLLLSGKLRPQPIAFAPWWRGTRPHRTPGLPWPKRWPAPATAVAPA